VIFEKLLKDQNYSQIIQQSEQAQSVIEKYCVLRSAFILGDKLKCEQFLEKYKTISELEPFCLAQQLAYHQGQWREGFEVLMPLKKTPQETFLMAETHFLLGFFLSSQCLFNLCPPYYKNAIEGYTSMGLINHASHAYFNLCIAFDHLKEKHLLAKTEKQFSNLVRANPSAKIATLLFERLKACFYLDREEFEMALKSYEKLITKYSALNRSRDLGAALWVKAYLVDKLSRNEKVESQPQLTLPHQKAIELFQWLEQGEGFDFSSTKAALKKFLAEGVLGVCIPYWLERVCASFEKNKKYSDLLNCARYAIDFCIKSQLDPYLIDFQYYEILSRLKLGDNSQAQYLLALYTEDNIENKFLARVKKSKKLKEMISLEFNFKGRPLALNIELDLNRHVLMVNGLEKKLAALLEKALLTLLNNHSCTLDQFFYEVYGVEYRPWNHERRLSTLIDRLRVLFGFKNSILRNNKEICLEERFRKIKIRARYGRIGKEKRKLQLEQKLKKIQRPVSISEIQNIVTIPRRTLQLDLSDMVKEGYLFSSGVRRNKKYWISQSVEV
jgi:hypothetical protein